MPRFFVTDPPVPVAEFEPGTVFADDGQPLRPNVMWIKPRMDVETSGKVKSELLQLGADQKTVEFRAGANELALLVHNIVRWEGPDLDGVPCTPETIRKLDRTEPLITRVLEAIAERNRPKASPDPKSPTASGSRPAGLSAASLASGGDGFLPSESGTLRSPLLSAVDGRLSK